MLPVLFPATLLLCLCVILYCALLCVVLVFFICSCQNPVRVLGSVSQFNRSSCVLSVFVFLLWLSPVCLVCLLVLVLRLFPSSWFSVPCWLATWFLFCVVRLCYGSCLVSRPGVSWVGPVLCCLIRVSCSCCPSCSCWLLSVPSRDSSRTIVYYVLPVSLVWVSVCLLFVCHSVSLTCGVVNVCFGILVSLLLSGYTWFLFLRSYAVFLWVCGTSCLFCDLYGVC